MFAPRPASSPLRTAAAGARRRAVALPLAALLALLAGAAAAALDLAPVLPRQQSSETDRMLRQLKSDAPPDVSPFSATALTSATRAPTTSTLSSRLRPTSGTLILRPRLPRINVGGLPDLALSGTTHSFETTDTLGSLVGSDLMSILRAKVAPRVTTSTTRGTPRIDPAWIPSVTAPTAHPLSTLVRINSATPDELRARLKLDPIRARYIVEFRTLYGRFKGPDDLSQVSGITGEMVLKWEEANLLDFN